MSIHYAIYIEGCGGEMLSIKPTVDQDAKGKLYYCLFYNSPSIYNTVSIRDADNIDGGRGNAGRATFVINSSPLGVELFNKLHDGMTIKNLFVYKLSSDPNSPQGVLIPTFTHKFSGVSLYSVGYHVSEQKTIFQGVDTNQFFMATFGFEILITNQKHIDASGKIECRNKGISNLHGEARSGR